MKKTLIICPAERPGMEPLAEKRPLALAPVCGTPLLHLAMRELAGNGVEDVLILAADRPAEIRRSIEGGAPWGVKAEVLATRTELTPAEAGRLETAAMGETTMLEDFLQTPSGESGLSGMRAWFAACAAQIPSGGDRRVGFREVLPGVVVHTSARIHEAAKLAAPAWIGANTVVAAEASIGSNAILEDDCIVDERAEIADSIVLSGSYIGREVEVAGRIVEGSRMTRWESGQSVEVKDAILLAELDDRETRALRPGFAGRLTASVILLVTAPLVALHWVCKRILGKRAMTRRIAVSPIDGREIAYWNLEARLMPWRRWPRLWSIARGEFRWVGNPPLTPAEACGLNAGHERLWLAAPIGMFTLADARDAKEGHSDEARWAHAIYYAAFRGFRLDCSILTGIVRYRLFVNE